MKMIFHSPIPLNPEATSASGIRPLKMQAAFVELGYEVQTISGYSDERKAQIQKIKQRIQQGETFDFVYSENSTMPISLTDRHHLPIRPNLDLNFYKFCKQNSIPVSVFYRDIFWKFDEYSKNVPFLKSLVAKFFYNYELKKFQKYIKTLYIPSLNMAKYIPHFDKNRMVALPPGANVTNPKPMNVKDQPIRLLYVGGLSNHYQMHVLTRTIAKYPNIQLTICTRKTEWAMQKKKYFQDAVPANIRVVHKSGAELTPLYQNADIAMLFVNPHEYWEFAVPVKLYEYIGNQKPIISSRGTLVGEYVEKNEIGWNIDYNENSLIELFDLLSSDPKLIPAKQSCLAEVAAQNTWLKRAEQVSLDSKKHVAQ